MAQAKRIYLDHAATAPMVDAAKRACIEGFELWANPSSPHRDGRAAQAILEDARKRLKQVLNWDGAVIFTGGASEAIAIALSQAKVERQFISPAEHSAVLRFARNSQMLSLSSNGLVDAMALNYQLEKAAVPALVAVQSVNNETGVIQDHQALNMVAREHGAIILADCAQSAGKLPLPAADMVVIAAHKFGGPPGVGALLVKDLRSLAAHGGQEQGYRSGTQNLPYIMAMVAALEAPTNWLERAADLRRHLDDAIKQAGGRVVADNSARIATIASYQMPGVAANIQLIKFDMAGFSVSAGSACSSGTLKTSHVLSAMNIDDKSASEVIRVSIGRDTSRSDIYAFIDQWKSIMAAAHHG